MIINKISKYDDDEAMIIAGKFADRMTELFFDRLKSGAEEAARNYIADLLEVDIKYYAGAAEGELPDELRQRMTRNAEKSLVRFIRGYLFRIGEVSLE